jgi:hypothetical protein
MSLESDIPGKIPKASFNRLVDPFYDLHVGGRFMRVVMKSSLFISEDFWKEMSRLDVMANAIVRGIRP